MRLWITMDRFGCVELWCHEPHETPGGQWMNGVGNMGSFEGPDADEYASEYDLREGSKVWFVATIESHLVDTEDGVEFTVAEDDE